jgi:hypothetical protein
MTALMLIPKSSKIDLASVVNINNKYGYNIIIDFRKDAIAPDTISPKLFEVAGKRLSELPGVCRSNKIFVDPVCDELTLRAVDFL